MNAARPNEGKPRAKQVDTSTLQRGYYTKTQVDSALTQKQNALSVTGNDDNATRGYKLVDSSGNLRSLRATNPYSVNINNNTDLVISGPPRVNVFGDDNTNGMKLLNTTEADNYVAKSLKASGYLRIYPDPNGTNALVINTTTDFNTLLDNKVTGPLPSLAGYINNVINDSLDMSVPKLVALDTSGNSLRINTAGLRAALGTKANVGAIPNVSEFFNAYTNMAQSNLITLSNTGQTLNITYQNPINARPLKTN